MTEPTYSPEKGWKPRTQAERTMLRQYRGWSRRRRMKAAMNEAIAGTDSISQVARNYGVTRTQLSRNLSELRGQQADAEAMAAEASLNESMASVGAGPKTKRRTYGRWGAEMPPYEEFDRYYFGHWACDECINPATGEGEVHASPEYIVKAVQDTLSLDRLGKGQLRRQILMPPGHSKTSHFTIRRSVYRICQNPNVRILIISKASSLAEDALGAIKEILTNEELYVPGRSLIQDFGPFYDPHLSRQWAADRIFVAGRTTASKDPTVVAIGRGGSPYGKRADDILMDDIVDMDRSKNPEMVEEDFNWVMRQVRNRAGAKYGTILDIGTRVRSGDLHAKINKRPDFEHVIIPAIIEEPSETNPDGVCLWPEHHPMPALLEERANDPIGFQLVFQQVDSGGLGASFTPAIVEPCLDKERVVGQFDPTWLLIAGLDPAGGSEQSGYTAFVLRGIDTLTGKRYLVDIVNHRSMKAWQIKDQIMLWSNQYPIYQWRIESNGMNAQIVQYDRDIVAKLAGMGIGVLPHQTGGNKWDPIFGVESSAPLFRSEMVSIPWGNRQSQQTFQPYIEQLYSFPMGELSDIVMADWFAEVGLREVLQRASAPMFHANMKVPRRIRRGRRIIDLVTGRERGIPEHEQRAGALHAPHRGERRSLVGYPKPHHEVVATAPEPEEDPWMQPGELVNVAPRQRHRSEDGLRSHHGRRSA